MLLEEMAFENKDELYSRITWDYEYVREDCFDKGVDGFESVGVVDWEMGNDIDYKSEKSGSVGDDVDDVDDWLPNDPFDMNISEAVTSFGGFLDDSESDLELKSLGFVGSGEEEVEKVDDQIFAGLNIILNGPVRLRPDCNNDVADLLPNDPFLGEFLDDLELDLELKSLGFFGSREGGVKKVEDQIFAGLFLDDLELDLELRSLGFVDSREGGDKKVDDQIFAGLNIILNSPLRLRPECDTESECVDEAETEKGLRDAHIFCYGLLGDEKYSITNDADSEDESCTIDNVVDTDSDGCCPPDALTYALSYLQVEDLLSVEMVCKSLHDLVQNDPLLWMNIHVDHPLSYKITNNALVRLTNRAQGRLRSLTLRECFDITNDSLKQVLENNPSLTKLSVAGCIKLKIDEFLCNLREFKSLHPPGIKRLRVAGMLGLKNEHFEELQLLLGVHDYMQSGFHKPRYYRSGEIYLSLDDARAVDLETCPRCLNLREVYDCPAVSCVNKQKTPQACRGCSACIPRCFRCGCCLSNRDYEENFFFYLHCLDSDQCCSDFQESGTRISISSNHTYLHQQASYHIYLCS